MSIKGSKAHVHQWHQYTGAGLFRFAGAGSTFSTYLTVSENDRVHREMKMIECFDKVATSWCLRSLKQIRAMPQFVLNLSRSD